METHLRPAGGAVLPRTRGTGQRVKGWPNARGRPRALLRRPDALNGPDAETAAGGPRVAFFLILPYFPWRLDLPEPLTVAVIAAVLLFCGWRLCRRS